MLKIFNNIVNSITSNYIYFTNHYVFNNDTVCIDTHISYTINYIIYYKYLHIFITDNINDNIYKNIDKYIYKNTSSNLPNDIYYYKTNSSIVTIVHYIIDVDIINNIINNCYNIAKINFECEYSNNLVCYDNSIHMIFICISKLSDIEFYNIKITDITLCEISHRYPNLKWIKMPMNNITNSGIYELVNKCTNIETLSLFYINKLNFNPNNSPVNLLNSSTLNLIIHKLIKLIYLSLHIDSKSINYKSLIHELTYLNNTTTIRLIFINYTHEEFDIVKSFCKKKFCENFCEMI